MERKTIGGELYKEGLRKCHKCQEIKSLSLFYKHSRGGGDGYAYACKKCSNNYVTNYRKDLEYRQSAAVRTKKYRELNKEGIREQAYFKKYGITHTQKIEIWERQDKKCKICGESIDAIEKAHLDHSHITNKIRGVLCIKCNTVLGLVNDDIHILKMAIEYLSENV